MNRRRALSVVTALLGLICQFPPGSQTLAPGPGWIGTPASAITNPHTIEGYSDQVSVAPGETIAFKIHAPAKNFSIEIVRIGAQRQVLKNEANLQGNSQDYPADAYVSGCSWQTSYTLTIPDDWQS